MLERQGGALKMDAAKGNLGISLWTFTVGRREEFRRLAGRDARALFSALARQERAARTAHLLMDLPLLDITREMEFRSGRGWWKKPIAEYVAIKGRTALGHVVLQSGERLTAVDPDVFAHQSQIGGVQIERLKRGFATFAKDPRTQKYFLYTPQHDKGVETPTFDWDARAKLALENLLPYTDKISAYREYGEKFESGRLLRIVGRAQRNGREYFVAQQAGNPNGAAVAYDAAYLVHELLRTSTLNPQAQKLKYNDRVSFMKGPNQRILVRHSQNHNRSPVSVPLQRSADRRIGCPRCGGNP